MPDEVDQGRIRAYTLSALLLAQPPGADLLSAIAAMRGDGTRLGDALAALAEAARAADPGQVEREYHHLFIGVARGELVPYASYYLTGFLMDRPLAQLRGDLAALGITQAQGRCEPEDHAAFILDAMAGLIEGRFGAPADLETQRHFFDQHVTPWVPRFLSDLERAEAAVFYRPVGRFGRVLLDIEREAFALTPA